MTMTSLPLSRARATAIVQEIAKDSGRWSINMPLGAGTGWRQLVNRRHISLCLREGLVQDEFATLDEHDCWRFEMERMCGGLYVRLEVALERSPAIPKLFVIGITGELVSLSEQ
jgi:hypothetical protein